MKSVLLVGLALLAVPAALAQAPDTLPDAAMKHVKSCCAPLPANLADWWTFDEPSGPTSADIGGNVNNVGTDNGAVTRGPGKVGRAATFNGSSWIHVRNQAEVDFSGSCVDDRGEAGTIDAWINTKETGTVAILDKRERGTGTLQGYEVYLYQGRIGFQMATGAGNYSCGSAGSACTNFTSPFTVNDGQWHFVAIAFTRCRGAQGTFYVDGQTAPFTPRVGNISSNTDLLIGREVPTMSGTYFRGTLDELEIFKRALPKPELDAIYNAGSGGKCRTFGKQ